MVKYEDAYVGMPVITNTDELNDDLNIPAGATGIVCDLKYMGQCGVALDTEHSQLHDCEGHCEYGHGWYIDVDLLNPVPKLPDLDIGDDIVLF